MGAASGACYLYAMIGERPPRADVDLQGGDGGPDRAELEAELDRARQALGETRAELERRNAELRASNARLLEANASLRSANDQLSESQAELQAMNAEFARLNADLLGLNAELGAKARELETVLDLVPIGIAIAHDPHCRDVRVNRHGAALLGVPGEALSGGSPDWRLTREGRPLAPEDAPLRAVWRSGASVRDARIEARGPDGQVRILQISAAPAPGPDGAPRLAIAVYDEVSRLVAAQAAAEARAAQQGFVAALGDRSLRGEPAEALVGAVPAALSPLLKAEFVKVLRRDPWSDDFTLVASVGFEAPLGTVVPGGADSQAGYTMGTSAPVIVEDLTVDTRFRGPALLREHGVVSGISAIVGEPGEAWGVIGAHSRARRAFTADDVACLQAVANVIAATVGRDAWRARQEVLVDELSHRVRNILATVQAIASATFREEADRKAADAFAGRLHALAAAQALETHSDGRDAQVAALVERQCAPLAATPGRVRLAGDSRLTVPARLARDLSLALHELVTNAAKHGALSTAEGVVEATWRREQRGGRPVLAVEWRERGTPAPSASPPRRGAGMRLLEALFRREGRVVDRRFTREGLDVLLEATLD